MEIDHWKVIRSKQNTFIITMDLFSKPVQPFRYGCCGRERSFYFSEEDAGRVLK